MVVTRDVSRVLAWSVKMSAERKDVWKVGPKDETMVEKTVGKLALWLALNLADSLESLLVAWKAGKMVEYWVASLAELTAEQ